MPAAQINNIPTSGPTQAHAEEVIREITIREWTRSMRTCLTNCDAFQLCAVCERGGAFAGMSPQQLMEDM